MSSSSKRVQVKWIKFPGESGTAEADAESGITRDDPALITSRSVPSQCRDSNTGAGRSVFTDDILPLILDNLQILSPKDLLNFRLVNRCWRNAATSVLLKRNVCAIVLKIGEVDLGGEENPNSYEELLDVDPKVDRKERIPPIFKFYSARPPHRLLPALTQLISTSPEFPSNSITFLPGCEKALRNLPMRLPNQNYLLEEDELTRLFSLWGKTIKKLSLSNRISSNIVEKLLFLHFPNVHSLDLSNCSSFEARDHKQNRVFHLKKRALRKNPNLTLPKLRRVYSGTEPTLPWCKTNFLKELLYISPNIDAVLDAGVGALSVLLKMRRTQLIKSLYFNPTSSHQFSTVLEQARRHELGFIKLTEFTVTLSQISGSNAVYRNVSKALNIILKKSKDTLEYLEVHVNPNDFLENIQIPPLKNLKCLKLVREHSPFGNPLGRETEVDGWVYDIQVFKFGCKEIPNNGIPPGYFQALSKVCLDVDSESMNTGSKLLAFFALEHTNGLSTVSGDILPTVTTLELTAFPEDDKKLGKLFPNLRHLMIKCDPLSELHNWVWRAFPKLESFYIYDYVPAKDKAVADNFFTGFSQELCTKFSANGVDTAPLDLSPEEIRCLRTEPYIGECGNLRELTVQFKEKISYMFVSKLTDLFALKGIIRQTKIVFSFKSQNLGVLEMEEIQKHLRAAAPYIEIRF